MGAHRRVSRSPSGARAHTRESTEADRRGSLSRARQGATCGIFLLSGLNLPTSELARAAVSVRLHTLIQGFNLLLIPLTTVLSCNALLAAGLLSPALRDGMVVMGLLPTTINMCVALSRSSGGDEAVAIFNAVLPAAVLGVALRLVRLSQHR